MIFAQEAEDIPLPEFEACQLPKALQFPGGDEGCAQIPGLGAELFDSLAVETLNKNKYNWPFKVRFIFIFCKMLI
jgi:hypothetical protein